MPPAQSSVLGMQNMFWDEIVPTSLCQHQKQLPLQSTQLILDSVIPRLRIWIQAGPLCKTTWMSTTLAASLVDKVHALHC